MSLTKLLEDQKQITTFEIHKAVIKKYLRDKFVQNGLSEYLSQLTTRQLSDCSIYLRGVQKGLNLTPPIRVDELEGHLLSVAYDFVLKEIGYN